MTLQNTVAQIFMPLYSTEYAQKHAQKYSGRGPIMAGSHVCSGGQFLKEMLMIGRSGPASSHLGSHAAVWAAMQPSGAPSRPYMPERGRAGGKPSFLLFATLAGIFHYFGFVQMRIHPECDLPAETAPSLWNSWQRCCNSAHRPANSLETVTMIMPASASPPLLAAVLQFRENLHFCCLPH